jgi:hypothetical protein
MEMHTDCGDLRRSEFDFNFRDQKNGIWCAALSTLQDGARELISSLPGLWLHRLHYLAVRMIC